MEAISAAARSAASAVPAAGVREAPAVREAGEEPRSGSIRPGRDEYRPEGPEGPTGRYWPERSPEGGLRVRFDGPESSEDPAGARESDRKGADGAPEKDAPGGEEQRCVCSTDRVDREIGALKKRQAELERQLHGETEAERIEALQRELEQVGRELAQKDNDAYRRQNATYTCL